MYVRPLIFSITRTSLHDGPGVRTVVYFKGCNMRCKWCHNPEGLEFERSILYNKNKCVHCRKCAEICENISIAGAVIIDRDKCRKCGKCTDICPAGALTAAGEEIMPDELIRLILKDKAYYDRSGGGVTLSGGECLLFPEFAAEILKACKEHGINTLIESALNVPWKNIEAVINYTDCFFVDIKHMDSELHKKFTGSDNCRILDNIKKLAGRHGDITVRVPVIPSVNDSKENLENIETFVKKCGIKKFEKLSYNNLAASKYEAIGKEYINFD